MLRTQVVVRVGGKPDEHRYLGDALEHPGPHATYTAVEDRAVHAPAVAHVPDLFPRNERLICYLDAAAGALGRVAVVAVGAYNVGRISAAFDPEWNAPPGAGARVTNQPGARALTRSYSPPVPVAPGAEIMAFHLGSTVVLLFQPGVRLEPALAPGQELRLGQPVASAR